jgi:hypothetical protein
MHFVHVKKIMLFDFLNTGFAKGIILAGLERVLRILVSVEGGSSSP